MIICGLLKFSGEVGSLELIREFNSHPSKEGQQIVLIFKKDNSGSEFSTVNFIIVKHTILKEVTWVFKGKKGENVKLHLGYQLVV